MKILAFIFIFFGIGISALMAQTAPDYFNRAANEYIYQNENVALNTIDTGLKSYPDDLPLINLRDKILKDKEEQEQQKQQEQQDQQNQEKKEQNEEQQEQEQNKEEEEQQNQEEQQDSEEGEDAEQKEQPQQAEEQETEEEGKEMEQPPKSRAEKLEELNLTEEKARMILEAMKNNEIQYIQQNKRKPTKRPDSSKPDW